MNITASTMLLLDVIEAAASASIAIERVKTMFDGSPDITPEEVEAVYNWALPRSKKRVELAKSYVK